MTLEGINFKDNLRTEIEEDLEATVAEYTEVLVAESKLSWFAGFFRTCELVSQKT